MRRMAERGEVMATTSWSGRVIGECIASHECLSRLCVQADAAYLPIIANLVAACSQLLDTGCVCEPDPLECGEPCECGYYECAEAVQSISPTDMAIIRDWIKEHKR